MIEDATTMNQQQRQKLFQFIAADREEEFPQCRKDAVDAHGKIRFSSSANAGFYQVCF